MLGFPGGNERVRKGPAILTRSIDGYEPGYLLPGIGLGGKWANRTEENLLIHQSDLGTAKAADD